MLPGVTDWSDAEKHLVPFLHNRADWERIRAALELRKVTRLLAVLGGEDRRPTAIQADSELSGWRVAAIDWDRHNAVARAFDDLVEEIDTEGG
jgi:hypothetical protein